MTNPAAYAVCSLNDVPNQKARSFQLLRIDDDGNQKAWNIVIIRWGKHLLGYVNRCPHDGTNLDWERHQFLDANGMRLMCGKHGALFELGNGVCVDGPCKGQSLEPVAVCLLDGDICITGVTLAEDDEPAEAEED